MTKTLSVYDELVWDRENPTRPEISELTLADTLAVLGMHTGTRVVVEVWPHCDWDGALDSLRAEGHLLPKLEDELPDLDPLPLEISNFYYGLWTPAVDFDGHTLASPRRVGGFTVDGMAFDGATLYGHYADYAASIHIKQRWSNNDDQGFTRLSLAVRFWGSWETPA